MTAFRWSVFEGTDQAVEQALGALADDLSHLHSITSRTYSVRKLFAVHIDDVFCRVVDGYAGEWNRLMLLGYRPSLTWHVAPAGKQGPARLESSRLATALWTSDIWRSRLVNACKSAFRLNKNSNAKALMRFAATLDTLVSVIDHCNGLTPRRTTGPDGQRLSQHADVAEAVYCELCWRATIYSSSPRSSEEYSSKRGSRRYCAQHDPSDPASGYRRDLAYKAVFDRERGALVHLGTSAFRVRLPPASYAEEDIRRAAYALVHAHLEGTKEKAMLLVRQGRSQSDIASQLGISRQAVSKALQSARKRIANAEHIRWGSRSFPL